MLAAAAFALLFAACAQALQQPANDWNLVRVADSTALCLDGSPAAFYMRSGSQANANKWIIHLEGGGWATDLGGHFARSQVRVQYHPRGDGQPHVPCRPRWAAA